MNIYKMVVTLEVDVPGFSVEDAVDAVMDEFGPGQYTSCKITDARVKIVDAV